jgi:hypothetical protein
VQNDEGTVGKHQFCNVTQWIPIVDRRGPSQVFCFGEVVQTL